MARLAVGFVLVFLWCCADQAKVRRDEQKISSLAKARSDYIAGLKALVAGEFDSAREYLESVSRGPAYVIYTPLAKIRLADVSMLEGHFEEAYEQYKEFIRTNPTDPNLHYVYFRLAEASARAMPKEFFLLPPPDRRDQTEVRQTLSALNEYLTNFPNSPYVIEAKAMRDGMVKIACSYELEVARFYLSRKKPEAARKRVERLFEEIPESRGLEEASYVLAKALAMSNNKERLEEECGRYLATFQHGRMRSLMKRLCKFSEKKNMEVPR